MWILYLCLHLTTGSPQLRYHFQHFNGAEFQGPQSSVHWTNGKRFQSVGNLRQYHQQPYGAAYRSYPCQNLVFRRLRYRPCQYQQPYSRQNRAFSGKYQNLPPARHYSRTEEQKKKEDEERRQAEEQQMVNNEREQSDLSTLEDDEDLSGFDEEGSTSFVGEEGSGQGGKAEGQWVDMLYPKYLKNI